ncbi:hypothetical protein GCM10011369_18540 [Neiella marina]|uniref:Uncharacterized protein n=1 Tax=Neiella marina TaxID=508461 RepID=A0A8J2XMB0_9GAMM|nr:hypothetical protein GCM10011369_18540 [Neiella marina]
MKRFEMKAAGTFLSGIPACMVILSIGVVLTTWASWYNNTLERRALLDDFQHVFWRK